MQRLVLGTAQLGMAYGIANQTGRPDQKTATEIVGRAWDEGIREFETAQSYGSSESVLGKAVAVIGISSQARIISKFDPALDHLDPRVLANSLAQSLDRMGIEKLFGIMLHSEKSLSLWSQGLSSALESLVHSGRVRYLGVSVYSPDKAIEAIQTEGLDWINVPANIFDRRFEKAGVFELARDKRKQVYVRSIFLQGLLLMPPEQLPRHMVFTRPLLEKARALASEMSVSIRTLALGYVKQAMPQAKAVFGAETVQQVRENCDGWKESALPSVVSEVRRLFDGTDERILNPSLWPPAGPDRKNQETK